MAQIVVAKIGKNLYGFEIEFVGQIENMLEYSPIPMAPPYVLGTGLIRGEVITLIDTPKLFKDSAEVVKNRIIVFRPTIEGRQHLLGLIFDDASQVITVDLTADLTPSNEVYGIDNVGYLKGVLKTKDSQLISLIDTEFLFEKTNMGVEVN